MIIHRKSLINFSLLVTTAIFSSYCISATSFTSIRVGGDGVGGEQKIRVHSEDDRTFFVDVPGCSMRADIQDGSAHDYFQNVMAGKIEFHELNEERFAIGAVQGASSEVAAAQFSEIVYEGLLRPVSTGNIFNSGGFCRAGRVYAFSLGKREGEMAIMIISLPSRVNISTGGKDIEVLVGILKKDWFSPRQESMAIDIVAAIAKIISKN